MSLVVHDRAMKKALRAADVEALIQRYLAYVDAFRTTGLPKQAPKRREGGGKND